MKKLIILSILLSSGTFRLLACDICGCGVGSYYIGILPDFSKRFLGIRYRYSSLQTHLGVNGERTAITADEDYHIAELWGAWNLGSRFRVMAVLPYNINHREVAGAGTTGDKNGVGDVALMGYFKLFEGVHSTASNRLFVHSLWIGAGVKLPSGTYDNSERSAENADSPNNFQLGTGSTDVTFNVAYDARLMDVGMNVNMLYKVNTNNKYDYRYGNKWTGNALLYYKFLIKQKLRIAPNAGVMVESAVQDREYHTFSVSQSGGHVTSGVFGAEIGLGRFSAGINYQKPISQSLAGGRVNAGSRLMTHVSVAF
ncbi:hypothetical protein SAMN05216436_101234 [bacterium A37T11]|nr:hypothetical protein SAMN05216436_101234 [bacterium A37T11]